MRVLFTVQPSSGHLRPLVPLARAVSHRGHEVAVCSAPSFRTEVEAYGLTHIGAGLDWTNSGPSAELPPPGPEFEKFIVRMFADITTRSMVPDLMDVADAWRPDLIVRESLEYGGCLVAEALGIPHASVAGNGYSAVDSPEVTHFPGNRRMVARAMARHRAELALPADPDHAMPFRHLHLCFTPPEWDGVDAPRPANSQFLRHENATRPGTSMPE